MMKDYWNPPYPVLSIWPSIATLELWNSMELASAYAFGIARNHPFVDSNKRTVFIVAATFLFLNGYIITASDKEVVETFLSLAAGELSEKELSLWFSKHTIQK